ncbi:DHH family phosphoesterase [Candidatus Uhrbacteria bacterium]|nr:DHH family phosphoesterase [Candidatus Uhrbacteria bacterium]
MILVTSYQDPDLDGTACSVAEAEFLVRQGEEAVAGLFGKLHREAQTVIRTFNFEWPLNAMEVIDQVDEIVLTDVSDLRGLAPQIDPQKVTVVIDHRKEYNPDDFPNADLQIELVGSAATLVTEHFMNEGIVPGKTAAYLLAGAIVSNTVNFQNKVTTSRDRLAYEWLQGQVEIPSDFVQTLFESKSTFTHENLFDEIEHDAAWFPFGQEKIGIAQLEIVRAQEFLDEFGSQLTGILEKLHKQQKVDRGFLSIIDIDRGVDVFVCPDASLQDVLTRALGISWKGDRATTSGIMMRKEIVPILRKIFD